ncbi:MAG: hypothetical protein ACRC06_11090 [Waterburya sp.]
MYGNTVHYKLIIKDLVITRSAFQGECTAVCPKEISLERSLQGVGNILKLFLVS